MHQQLDNTQDHLFLLTALVGEILLLLGADP